MASSVERLIGGCEDAIGHLVNGLAGGQLTPAQWHNEVLHTLGEYHTAAYLVGRDTTTISDPAQRFLLDTMGKQADYLGHFTDAIEDGRLSDAEIRARAQSYAGALHATADRARTWDWPLPFFPADGGTPCRTNCRCSWQGRGLDLEELTGDWYWSLSPGDTCEGCRARADGNPYSVIGGELQ